MSIKPDHWIRRMCQEHGMIEPFEEKLVRQGVISHGLSSYGYDIRVAREFKIFTNVNSTVLDPKNLDPRNMVDFEGDVCIVPPNSFALARTVEYFRIPRNVLAVTVGKCLTGDTRVVDAETGDWVELREFVRERRARTVGLNRWRLGGAEVTEHISSGVQPVFRVRLRSGLEFKATPEHPLRTITRWARLCDLAPGARVAVARSLPTFGSAAMPAHEAMLLGLLLSDGQCRTPGSSPRYTTADPALASAFEQAVNDFGSQCSPVGRYGYNAVNRRGRGGRAEPNRVYRFLLAHGCAVKSADKHVPRVIFRAERESVRIFLRALFSGDGSVYPNGEHGIGLEYASISRRLVEDVRHLLLRFGIFALIRPKIGADGYRSYRVQINDPSMLRKFAHEVGFLPGCRKQARLEAIVSERAQGERSRSNFDTLPPEAWELLRTTVRASSFRAGDLGLGTGAGGQSVGMAVAQSVARSLPETDWARLVEADVVWDRIESIEFAGEEETFDLTVPAGSNFVANDVVVHNSTYARCGIITNVTPFEPEWEGHVTLEISNTTPLPAKIYAGEGLAQVLFYESDSPCEVSYKDRSGKYQKQTGITLPRI